jgi:anti-sigma regulatory factor (Ser/Thr protein kinase)
MPFSALQETDFFGRGEELAGLSRRVLQADKGMAQSAVLSGPRGIGKTELLKQLFGSLFWRQDHVVPFYYTVNPALLSAAAFSKNYLTQYLCQRLAFEKKEQSLLYLDGMSIDGLSALVEEREAVWAREILDRYIQSTGDPADALRIALSAPHQSAMATGMPVAILIDEFHRLKGLHIDGAPDPRLISLFEVPMSFQKSTHVITGNEAEIFEMPVASRLERIPVQPLGPEDASSRALSLLHAYEAEGKTPPLLLRHLGGNPFYLGCVLRTACDKKNLEEKDFWKAYAREIVEGALALSWSSILKSYFPDVGLRRAALAIVYKIYHTSEPLSCRRIAKSFALTDTQAEAIAYALYLAGFVRGEFGVFRAVEDRVVRDIIDCLYMKEILGKPAHDLEQEFLEKSLPEKEGVLRFDMTLPMIKEAELVAAQCLEQIGKTLHINQDAIGQLQIAVIEACINAIEHSKGTEKKIYVSFVADGDRVEVSIESAGREFVVQETGEPFGDREHAKASGRGWGIKMMKRFADEVRFEKTARGTKTVLVKNLSKSAGVQKEDTANRE